MEFKKLTQLTEVLHSQILDKCQELEEKIKEDVIDFSHDQITSLQTRLKSLEEKLKEAQKAKVKVKTITITEETHDIIKKYCVENNLKISEWADSALLSQTQKRTKFGLSHELEEQIQNLDKK